MAELENRIRHSFPTSLRENNPKARGRCIQKAELSGSLEPIAVALGSSRPRNCSPLGGHAPLIQLRVFVHGAHHVDTVG